MSGVRYSVVIPAYNEEVIEESYRRLKKVMDTGNLMNSFCKRQQQRRNRGLSLPGCFRRQKCKMISFSRNFGHQTAITAGMDAASRS